MKRHASSILWLLAAGLLLSGCFGSLAPNLPLTPKGSVNGTVSIASFNACTTVVGAARLAGLGWLPPGVDELVVRFRPGVGAGRARAVLSALDLEVLRYNELIDAYIVRAPSPSLLQRAFERLQRDGAVRSVEPNYVFESLSVEPNDPEYGRQRWHFELANVPAAWAAGHADAGDVVVAVLDGGFQLDHPDLEGRWYKPYDAVAGMEGWFADDGDPAALAHGSHVAGIIGAVTGNGVGTAGVAWDVRLMPVRVMRWQAGSYRGTLDVVAAGVRYAVDNGAHVINMSLGQNPLQAGGSAVSLLAEELERAYRRGVTVIAAAGNTAGMELLYPACDPHVIAVGGLTQSTAGAVVAPRSAYGPAVTLFAPGGGAGWQVWSANRTAGPEQYRGADGTSMAAAHVSGVAALLYAAGVREPERVKAALCLGAARPPTYDGNVHGPCGLLDAYGALDVADPPGLADVQVLVGRREGGTFVVQAAAEARAEGGFTVTGVPDGAWEVLAWVPRSAPDAVRPGDLLGRTGVYLNGAVAGVHIVLAPVAEGEEPLPVRRFREARRRRDRGRRGGAAAAARATGSRPDSAVAAGRRWPLASGGGL